MGGVDGAMHAGSTNVHQQSEAHEATLTAHNKVSRHIRACFCRYRAVPLRHPRGRPNAPRRHLIALIDGDCPGGRREQDEARGSQRRRKAASDGVHPALCGVTQAVHEYAGRVCGAAARLQDDSTMRTMALNMRAHLARKNAGEREGSSKDAAAVVQGGGPQHQRRAADACSAKATRSASSKKAGRGRPGPGRPVAGRC